MSERGRRFFEDWLSENINVEAYDPPRGVILAYAAQLTADAEAENIPIAEIEEEFGGIEGAIAQACEDRTDQEVQRLADRDG